MLKKKLLLPIALLLFLCWTFISNDLVNAITTPIANLYKGILTFPSDSWVDELEAASEFGFDGSYGTYYTYHSFDFNLSTQTEITVIGTVDDLVSTQYINGFILHIVDSNYNVYDLYSLSNNKNYSYSSFTFNKDLPAGSYTASVIVASDSPVSDSFNINITAASEETSTSEATSNTTDYYKTLYDQKYLDTYSAALTTDGTVYKRTYFDDSAFYIEKDTAVQILIKRAKTAYSGFYGQNKTEKLYVYNLVTKKELQISDNLGFDQANPRVINVSLPAGIYLIKYKFYKTTCYDFYISLNNLGNTSLTPEITSSKTLNVGDSILLTSNIAYSEISGWKSSNTKIATVSQSGEVSAVAFGKCKITLSLKNGKTATCNLTVKEPKYKLQSKLRLKEKSSDTLLLTLDEIEVLVPGVVWTSDNTKIASIYKDSGLINAKNPGTCNITAKLPSGKILTCKVTVIALTFEEKIEKQKAYTTDLKTINYDNYGFPYLDIIISNNTSTNITYVELLVYQYDNKGSRIYSTDINYNYNGNVPANYNALPSIKINSKTRKIHSIVTKVYFSDGKTWTNPLLSEWKKKYSSKY